MGYEPFPLQPLTPHSLSRRTRDLLAGHLGAHRDLPVDREAEPVVAAPEKPSVAPAPSRAYDTADATKAWDRAPSRTPAASSTRCMAWTPTTPAIGTSMSKPADRVDVQDDRS